MMTGLKLNHDVLHTDRDKLLESIRLPDVAIWNPVQLFQEWKVHRRCNKLYGHCFHPTGYAVDWNCCMCLKYQDGLPRDNCKLCSGIE